jgi:hypothetical protein
MMRLTILLSDHHQVSKCQFHINLKKLSMERNFKIDQTIYARFISQWLNYQYWALFIIFLGGLVFCLPAFISGRLIGILVMAIGLIFAMWRFCFRWMQVKIKSINRIVTELLFDDNGLNFETEGLSALGGLIKTRPISIQLSRRDFEIKGPVENRPVENKYLKKVYLIVVGNVEYYLVDGFFDDMPIILSNFSVEDALQ